MEVISEYLSFFFMRILSHVPCISLLVDNGQPCRNNVEQFFWCRPFIKDCGAKPGRVECWLPLK